MKLASLKHGRDGHLVVVSRDLKRASDATRVALTLQNALDDWERAGPRLAELARALEAGAAASFPFQEEDCASPLPRAFQWLNGSAYGHHLALLRAATGVAPEIAPETEPVMWPGGGSTFLGPREPIVLPDEGLGADLAAEVAVVTGDVPMGVTAEAARDHILLVMLANDMALREIWPREEARGAGLVQSRPASAFSPVAVTPDELGNAWDGNRLHLPILVSIKQRLFGKPNAGVDMTFDFPTLIAHAARTRRLGAGTIIGSGPVSNRDASGGPGQPVDQGGLGYACIAEHRAFEQVAGGGVATPYLRLGDRVRIEMKDAKGRTIFGAIDQLIDRPR